MADGTIDLPPPLSVEDIDEIGRRFEFESTSYVARWATFVEPPLSREQEWSKFAIDFATFGVKSLTTLNGGGIFLFGPVFEALGKKPSAIDYFVAIFLFSSGLLVALFALMCGFFACARRAEGFALQADRQAQITNMQFQNADAHYTAMLLRKRFQPKSTQFPLDESPQKLTAYNFWRTAGIAAIFFSIACFLSGVGWSIFSTYS